MLSRCLRIRVSRFQSREARSWAGRTMRWWCRLSLRSIPVSPLPRKAKRKAERRETLFRNLRVIGRGSHPFRNALAFRRSTTALTQRTRHPKGSASGQASWEEAPKHGLQAASASTHFQRCTSRTGRNAGRLMPELPGSRVQAHPRAPPPLRQPACLPVSVLQRAGMLYVTVSVTNVKRVVTPLSCHAPRRRGTQ
jgi:hypothetical protein